jgi:hypothetical protein
MQLQLPKTENLRVLLLLDVALQLVGFYIFSVNDMYVRFVQEHFVLRNELKGVT